MGGEGPFTVFAPTDDAFAALPSALVRCLLLPENKGALTSILTYHVADGSVVSADLSDGQEVPTLEGSTVAIDVSDSGVNVNGANVVIADVPAANGVIHAIDGVLVPPSIDVTAFLETCSSEGKEEEDNDETDAQPSSGIETEPIVPSVDSESDT